MFSFVDRNELLQVLRLSCEDEQAWHHESFPWNLGPLSMTGHNTADPAVSFLKEEPASSTDLSGHMANHNSAFPDSHCILIVRVTGLNVDLQLFTCDGSPHFFKYVMPSHGTLNSERSSHDFRFG